MTCHFINYLDGHRYVLSVILSFLNEVDGTCLLITNTTWYKRILPIFEIPPDLLNIQAGDVGSCPHQNIHNDKDQNKDDAFIHHVSKLSRRKVRHRFIPMPIQCPWVLLDRLNCIRLKRRMQYLNRIGMQQRQKRTMQPSHVQGQMLLPYPVNMTTEEIAWYEWTRDRWHFLLVQHGRNTQSSSLSELPALSIMPTKYELVRFRSPPTSSSAAATAAAGENGCNYDFKSPPEYVNILLRHPSITSQTISMPPKILPGVTLLASYPRSGNTLLRTLLEKVTGIVTGSDTRPDRTLSKALSTVHSLVGEGITSHSKVCIIKTHFPERRGYMMYNAKRVILLVRNPFDAIDSYWNMCCTNTHTESVSEDVYERYRDKFRALALNEMGTWADFLRYWLLNCDTTLRQSNDVCDSHSGSGGPCILLVRFEDLVQNTEKVMQEVIRFMTVECPLKDMPLHPFWKWRIRRALNLECHLDTSNNKDSKVNNVSVDTTKLGSYEPRSMNDGDSCSKRKKSSFGKSLLKNRYSAQDLCNMQDTVEKKVLYQSSGQRVNLLQLFGYDVFLQGFPRNFDEPNMEDSWSFIYPTEMGKSKMSSTIRVNQGQELRPPGSPYGRAMTRWRKSQTCDDTKPFERKSK